MSDDAFLPDDPFDGPDEEANEHAKFINLQQYQKALEEEWERDERVKGAITDLTPGEIREKTKELLTQGVPKAVGMLVHLAQHANSENVRLKAATAILDRAIGTEAAGLVGDPVEELLRSINKASTQADSTD